MMKIRVSDHLDVDYIHLVLNSESSRNFVRERATGTSGSMPKINQTTVLSLPIPLPPVAQQHRIVAKVDRLMVLCDELESKQQQQSKARERLSNTLIDKLLTACEPAEFDEHWQRFCAHFDLLYDTPDTIGKLRQAILQLAVQGKLVPQDPEDEPASSLLKKITFEKKQEADRRMHRKANSLNRKSRDSFPYNLPKTWEWVR